MARELVEYNQCSVRHLKIEWLPFILDEGKNDEANTGLSVRRGDSGCGRHQRTVGMHNVPLYNNYIGRNLLPMVAANVAHSHAVVMETLKPITGEPVTSVIISNEQLTSEPDLSQIPVPIAWWNDDNHTLSDHSALLGNSLEALRNVSKPGEFPSSTVLGMVVQDPQLFTPSKNSDMVCAFYPS